MRFRVRPTVQGVLRAPRHALRQAEAQRGVEQASQREPAPARTLGVRQMSQKVRRQTDLDSAPAQAPEKNILVSVVHEHLQDAGATKNA